MEEGLIAMSYSITDVLDSLIVLEGNGFKLYNSIANSNEVLPNQTRLTAQVLAKEEERHADLLTEIKDKFRNINDEIDVDIYNRINLLTLEFNSILSKPFIQNVNQQISFAYEFEKNIVTFLNQLKDLLVKGTSFLYCYTMLYQLVKDEEKHVRNLERFLKLQTSV